MGPPSPIDSDACTLVHIFEDRWYLMWHTVTPVTTTAITIVTTGTITSGVEMIPRDAHSPKHKDGGELRLAESYHGNLRLVSRGSSDPSHHDTTYCYLLFLSSDLRYSPQMRIAGYRMQNVKGPLLTGTSRGRHTITYRNRRQRTSCITPFTSTPRLHRCTQRFV